MRIGQKSAVVFLAKIIGSVIGFLSVVYFARVLGAEVLGFYAIALSIVTWLTLPATAGISSAIIKRISEGEEPGGYYAAGIVSIVILGILVALITSQLDWAIDAYVGTQATGYIVLMFLALLFLRAVGTVLSGERKPHIATLLDSGQLVLGSVSKVILVMIGFGLAGLFLGYIAGAAVMGVIGLLLISSDLQPPRIKHFKGLFNFARYSWIGSVQSRVHGNIDILILGALVPSALVGIYSVVWNLGAVTKLFSDSITTTLFPEISRADAANNDDLVADLIEDSLRYSGLIAIPSLFGGLLLGQEILRIYGTEFTQGALILKVILLSLLIHGYHQQLMNGLNALDRPDIAFRVNTVYIIANVSLNIGLISWIGWLGAALATGLSATLSLILAYRSLTQLVDLPIPSHELGRQLIAAVLMAFSVSIFQNYIEIPILPTTTDDTIVWVITGSIVYFIALLSISSEFRGTLLENAEFFNALTGR